MSLIIRNDETSHVATPNLPKIVDFRGLDSSIIFIQRGGILMSVGDFPENLSQAMLVGCNASREIGRNPHPPWPALQGQVYHIIVYDTIVYYTIVYYSIVHYIMLYYSIL